MFRHTLIVDESHLLPFPAPKATVTPRLSSEGLAALAQTHQGRLLRQADLHGEFKRVSAALAEANRAVDESLGSLGAQCRSYNGGQPLNIPLDGKSFLRVEILLHPMAEVCTTRAEVQALEV